MNPTQTGVGGGGFSTTSIIFVQIAGWGLKLIFTYYVSYREIVENRYKIMYHISLFKTIFKKSRSSPRHLYIKKFYTVKNESARATKK